MERVTASEGSDFADFVFFYHNTQLKERGINCGLKGVQGCLTAKLNVFRCLLITSTLYAWASVSQIVRETVRRGEMGLPTAELTCQSVFIIQHLAMNCSRAFTRKKANNFV